MATTVPSPVATEAWGYTSGEMSSYTAPPVGGTARVTTFGRDTAGRVKTVADPSGRTMTDTLTRAAALDQLAALEPAAGGTIEHTVLRLSRDSGGASLAVVTGRCSSRDLAFLSPLRNRFEVTTIARFGTRATGEITLSEGAVVINAAHVSEFARAWNRRAR